ncbi:MAG: hypothetical protein WC794_06360 [Candidatus Doudnabacteria bacterium]|jgi:hypothetical protein
MAHFSSEIQGSQGGEATGWGTKTSGIQCYISGWNLGCLVRMRYNETKQEDVLEIYVNGGSNCFEKDILLLQINQTQWKNCAKDINFLVPAKIININEEK